MEAASSGKHVFRSAHRCTASTLCPVFTKCSLSPSQRVHVVSLSLDPSLTLPSLEQEVEDGKAQLRWICVFHHAVSSSSTVHSSQSGGRLVALSLSLACGQPTTTAHCGPPSYHPLLWQGPSFGQGVQLYWASLSLSLSLVALMAGAS